MYITTFYSFKGGAGRSMALVNVAVELANDGRKVLLVDFDLEAPGLDTFLGLESSKHSGIVDYINEYQIRGQAPATVVPYIQECRPWKKKGPTLFLMSAGRQDREYGAKLVNINWQYLYAERQGYLLFEHLKQQWHNELAPDYVLVDSRTGYTEESGICTRQLPDAVVVIFFPNEQNRYGISKIVSDVREDARISGKGVTLHFAASNVPYLDDENHVIEEKMNEFKIAFKSAEDIDVIHHYDSIDLMQQKIFSAERPNTRLAIEYRQLADTIVERNPEDRSGILAYLGKLERRAATLDSTRTLLDDISLKYPKDAEVIFAVAKVWSSVDVLDEAYTLLTRVLELGDRRAEVYRRRAMVLQQIGRYDEGRNDIDAAVRCKDVSYVDLMMALQALGNDKSRLSALLRESLPQASGRISVEQKRLLIQQLTCENLFVELALPLAQQVMNTPGYEGAGKSALTLCLIHLQRYPEAMAVLGERVKLEEISDTFNYAMAEWAQAGTIPKDLFQKVAAVISEGSDVERDANVHQCFAITLWAIGENDKAIRELDEARRQLDRRGGRSFSAWSYLHVTRRVFETECNELQDMIEGRTDTLPAFMTRAQLGN